MMRITLATFITMILGVPTAVMLSGCQGIFSDIYDRPSDSVVCGDNQIVVDASDWGSWHYVDLETKSTIAMPIPTEPSGDGTGTSGIYTYWYDVFGSGIVNCEYRGFTPCAPQPEPGNWDFAVHRNNVRTNGGAAFETSFTSIEQLPSDASWLETLEFTEDEWNETDVWAVQDRMLSGLIGNQGISINNVLGRWLKIEIPPMPPTFSQNSNVFILRLADGSYAAIQLVDYIGADGAGFSLKINYKYPL